MVSTIKRGFIKEHFAILIVSIGAGIALGNVIQGSFLETTSIIFTFFCFGDFIRTLGKSINIKHLIVLIASIQYLFMPVITYSVFNEGNEFSLLWQTFMVIDSKTYFQFALSGTILLWIGLHIRFFEPHSDKELMERASEYLSTRSLIGYGLMGTGIAMSAIYKYGPEVLIGTLYFFTQLTFIGALYLSFSKIRTKRFIQFAVFSILVVQSILTGMYGELVFWSILGLILLSIRINKLSIARKYLFVILGMVVILLIQSIKHEYREKVWDFGVRRNDPGLWLSLVGERITDPASLFEPERLYKMTVRGNQGHIIGRIFNYVPKHEPYAKGETISTAILASFIPRLVWPSKPISGGKEKTCRFMGECGKRDYAYNLGQLGEAYVNFGKAGGAITMFFYGLLINYFLSRVRRKSFNIPSLILWSPLFFYSFLSLETDFLTSLNTFLKGIIFYLIIRYFLLLLFRIKI